MLHKLMSRKLPIWGFALVTLSLAQFNIASAEPSGGKFALVIGNSDYTGIDKISGAVDAQDMETYLRQINFDVIAIINGHRGDITDALKAFKEKIAKASVVLFFYSGHGFQLNQTNYLVPIGGTASFSDPDNAPVSLNEVLVKLGAAPDDSVKLVLLDACRNEPDLAAGAPQGLAKPPVQAPSTTLFAFAAGYGQVAASGSPKERSPYTNELLRHIREPGLEIRKLLAQVHGDVLFATDFTQEPREEGLDALPTEFYLSDPVHVHAEIADNNSDLFILLNGDIVLDSSSALTGDLRLNAGENKLALMVSNGKTYHNGHTWERTEGWKYALTLMGPDKFEVLRLGDEEPVPFKDGPHHGKVFTVARAKVMVDPTTAAVTVPAQDLQAKLWNSDSPIFAQDQEKDPLFEEKVKDLPLDKILDPAKFPSFGVLSADFLIPLLRELLTTGKLVGQAVADPERTFFVVRGNKVLKDLVRTCVVDNLNDRLDDFRASVAAALNREATPFTSFDKNLTQCIRDTGKNAGSRLPLDELKVWTAIEDRSDEQPTGTPPVATGQGGQP